MILADVSFHICLILVIILDQTNGLSNESIDSKTTPRPPGVTADPEKVQHAVIEYVKKHPRLANKLMSAPMAAEAGFKPLSPNSPNFAPTLDTTNTSPNNTASEEDDEGPPPSFLTDVVGLGPILASLTGEQDSPAVKYLPGLLGPLAPVLDPLLDPIGKAADPLLGPVVNGLGPVFAGLETVLAPILGPVLSASGDTLKKVTDTLRNYVIAPLAKLLSPVGSLLAFLLSPFKKLTGDTSGVTESVPSTTVAPIPNIPQPRPPIGRKK